MIEDHLAIDLQVLQIVKMVLGLLYLMHILGCFWFYVAVESGEESTWLASYDGGSGLTENGADVDTQYLYSIYWALMTLTTVGYGDITPANNAERGYALASLLIGALVFGYMLSAISELVSSLDKQGIRVQEHLDEVKEFTRWHKMSPDLATKVRKYYEFYYSKQGTHAASIQHTRTHHPLLSPSPPFPLTPSGPMDDADIVSKFAPALSRDVMSHILSQTVCRMPFFFVPALGKQDEDNPPADIDFQLSVYPLLKPLLREPNEVVLEKGGSGGDLLFLNKGNIQVWGDYSINRDENTRGPPGRMLYKIDESGDFLTEHVLVDLPCASSYVAATRCELYALDLQELLKLIERYPHARQELAYFTAEDFIEQRKKTVWSLRFAQCEKIKQPKIGGRSSSPTSTTPRRQFDWRQRGEENRMALKLQIAWWRKKIAELEAMAIRHQYTELLPVLYGKTPKWQMARMRQSRLKRAERASMVGTDAGASGAILPFGGKFSPRINAAASGSGRTKGGRRLL